MPVDHGQDFLLLNAAYQHHQPRTDKTLQMMQFGLWPILASIALDFAFKFGYGSVNNSFRVSENHMEHSSRAHVGYGWLRLNTSVHHFENDCGARLGRGTEKPGSSSLLGTSEASPQGANHMN